MALALAASCAALGVASVAILQYREVLHFRFLADRIPKAKRRALPERSFPLIFQTAAASMVSYGTCAKLGLVYFTPPSFTLSFWLSIFGPFYALLALRDNLRDDARPRHRLPVHARHLLIERRPVEGPLEHLAQRGAGIQVSL